MGTSATIIAGLREIGWLLSIRQEDFFRSRAYRKAADALVRYDGDLEALIDGGRVTELPGVGQKTAQVIGELHQTGRCHQLSELRRRFPREVARLARVPGLGLTRLQTLHQEVGIETVDDLRKACAAGGLAQVRGFGPSTIKKIQSALVAFDDAPARLLLPHARQLATRLAESWSSHLQVHLQPTGELRRRSAAVERIRLVGASARRELTELPIVGPVEPLEPSSDVPGLVGWQAKTPEGVVAELWLAPEPVFGAALLATTGPEPFTRAVLPRALVHDDEANLLKSAGLSVWPPELRDAYVEGAEVPLLVDRALLSGVVHVHTTDSDGRDDLRRLAEEAKALGYEYLTVTDHSPSAHYAHGLGLAELERQGTLIRRVEAETGIRILRGTESDILPGGGLDHPIEVLEALDLVIASIHGGFRLGPEAMTERLLKTFDLPVRMIWGHPLGRLVLSRPGIAADLPRILDRIAERGHIIEVNGDPHRMDLPPEWIRQARRRGIPFVLSADAHSARGLQMADTAVDGGRAGGLGPSDVLNTLDVDAFMAAVRPTAS